MSEDKSAELSGASNPDNWERRDDGELYYKGSDGEQIPPEVLEKLAQPNAGSFAEILRALDKRSPRAEGSPGGQQNNEELAPDVPVAVHQGQQADGSADIALPQNTTSQDDDPGFPPRREPLPQGVVDQLARNEPLGLDDIRRMVGQPVPSENVLDQVANGAPGHMDTNMGEDPRLQAAGPGQVHRPLGEVFQRMQMGEVPPVSQVPQEAVQERPASPAQPTGRATSK